MGVVYMIRNIKNGKRYIGQSKQVGDTRFKQHLAAAYLEGRRAYNTCLSRAIRKYGKDCFEFGIIADNVPDEDLTLVEAHYIDMYDTIAPNGYNTSPGMNDNSNSDEIKSLAPDENYADNARVVLDNISEDDVNKFLREL